MAKQWDKQYAAKESLSARLEPHLLFNAGRITSFGLLGGLLGAIGGIQNISLSIGSILTIAVSVMMVVLALQMLGWRKVQGFQFRVPRFMSRYVSDEKNFQG